MLEIHRTTLTELEVTGSGILDLHDVKAAAAALDAALDSDGRAILLIDLRGVEDVTMKAFTRDALSDTPLLSSPERLEWLERVAVLGDAAGLEALSRWRERALPGLPVRRFDDSQSEAARAWLRACGTTGSEIRPEVLTAPQEGVPPSLEALFESVLESFGGIARQRGPDHDVGQRADHEPDYDDGPVPHASHSGGLRLADEDGLLVIDIDGRIAQADLERLAARLDAPASERVRLLVRVRRFGGIDPAALLSPALLRLQRDGLSRLSRVALVTSGDWLGRALESTVRLQQVRVRAFAPGGEAAARAWLMDETDG